MWPKALPEETTSFEERGRSLVQRLIARRSALQHRPSQLQASLEEFGKTIRALRNRRQLSRAALAQEAGLHPAFISFLENGEALEEELSPEVLETIARTLSLPPFMLKAMLPDFEEADYRAAPVIVPLAASEARGNAAEDTSQAEPSLLLVPDTELDIVGSQGIRRYKVWMDSEGNVFLRPGSEAGATHLHIHSQRYPVDARMIDGQETIAISGLKITELLDFLEAEDEHEHPAKFTSEIS